MENDTVMEFIALLREKDAHTSEMVQALIQANASQGEVLKSWMDLFKPPAQGIASTTPETRESIAELASASDWVPLTQAQMAAALHEDLT
jgi:hypothetical protein